MAETIARVSGIQVRHEAGEANSVLIRGLPGIATMLNGREMFTTIGRYIQLADIPSTMLQRVDVYKSQGAGQIEGGIAGVVDVRTNRPFDFKGQTTAVNFGLRNKDKANTTDPEGSAMYSNRWKTDAGEFGALIGVSYVKASNCMPKAWPRTTRTATRPTSSSACRGGRTAPASPAPRSRAPTSWTR